GPRLFTKRRERIIAVRSMAEKRVTELAVGSEQGKTLLQHATDTVFQLLMACHGLKNGVMAALLYLMVKSQDNGFFRREVVISSAQCHSRFGRDIAHGCLLKAFLAEKLQRSFIDPPARIFCARRGTHFHCRYVHRR